MSGVIDCNTPLAFLKDRSFVITPRTHPKFNPKKGYDIENEIQSINVVEVEEGHNMYTAPHVCLATTLREPP